VTRAIIAGILYFAAAFALGFVLGTLRTLWLAPRLGAVAATALELPVMLAFSWLACGWFVRRWRVPDTLTARLAMGATAFVLLMIAEAGVSVLLLGRTVRDHFATYRELAPLLGLAAQIAFALFPTFHRR
jgi:ABC-type uncharacterized transport system permease subunit